MAPKKDKSFKATSAAKAAEALAARGALGGFGGFSGLTPVAGFGFGAPPVVAAAPAAAAAAEAASQWGADEPALTGALDGEVAQCLRHLSKKDATTKLKALAALRELCGSKQPADLAAALPPWAYHFQRLTSDAAKPVRCEALAAMAALAGAVGRALAPSLKTLLPPWWLAACDPYADVAAAARRSLAEAFPGQKQTAALVLCRAEVADYIADLLGPSPAALGDARRESAEELAERRERATAAALTGAAALLRALAAAAAAAAGDGAGQQQQQQQDHGGQNQQQQQQQAAAAAAKALADAEARLGAALAAPGFFKRHLGAKSALVRRAAYAMVAGIAASAPALLGGAALEPAASAVLGALGDKDPSNQAALWEMLLAFPRAQLECWRAVSVPKLVAPRLYALLRAGCGGAPAAALPALLPFVASLPPALLAPAAPLDTADSLQQPAQPQPFMANLLESLWQGLPLFGGAQGRAAVVEAYADVLGWALRSSARLSALPPGGNSGVDGGAEQQQLDVAAMAPLEAAQRQRAYCRQLLAAHFAPALLPLAFGGGRGADGATALDVARGLLLRLVNAPAAAAADAALSVEADEVVTAIGAAAAAALAPPQQQQEEAAAALAAQQEAAVAQVRLLVSALLPPDQQQQQQQQQSKQQPAAAAAAAAAAEKLVRAAAGALAPAIAAGTPLPPAASELLSEGVRRFGVVPGMADSSTAVPAAAAASAASAPPTGAAVAPALVRAGIDAVGGSGAAAAAASADLLVACLQADADPPRAWASVMADLLSTAPGEQPPRLRFAALLLERLAAAPGAAESWRCGELDAGAARLFDGLAAGSDVAAGPLSQLLAAALGANERRALLLSDEAAGALVAAIVRACDGSGAAAAAAAAACGCEALHAALAVGHDDSGSHETSGGSSSSSSSDLWARQPAAVAGLLPAVFRLSWGHRGEQRAATAAEDEALADWADAGHGSSSDGSSGSISSSSGSEPDSDGEAADAADGGSAGGSEDGGDGGPVAAARLAAARLWNGGGLLAAALERLPASMLDGLADATGDALVAGVAAACTPSSSETGASSAEGRAWAHRAACAAHGLRRAPHLRSRLLERLFAAAGAHAAWCSPSGGECASDGSSSATATELAAALALRAGPESTLEAARSVAAAEAGSAGWLAGELLCARAAAGAAASANVSDAALLVARATLEAAADAGADAEAAAATPADALLALLWGCAARDEGATYSLALVEALHIAASGAPSEGALLRAVQRFCARTLAPAAAQARSLAAGEASALEAAIAAAAPALRSAGPDAIAAAGLDALSASLCRQAIDAFDGGAATEAAGSDEVLLMGLAVACFPVPGDGDGGAPSDTASTPGERQALMALLRAASSVQQPASSSTQQQQGDGDSAGAERGRARERLASALQLRGVAYAWPDMGAPEWHAVLRDVQRHTSAARGAAQRLAGRAAAAACAAAATLLGGGGGGGGGGAAAAPVTAVPLLLKLSSKGILQRHAAYAGFVSSIDAALAGADFGPSWRASLRLLAAVQRLRGDVQAGGRAPQLQLALASVQGELYAVILAVGALVSVAGSAGPDVARAALRWADARRDDWRLLATCLDAGGGGGGGAAAAADGHAAAETALQAADARTEHVGIDAMGCLLALLHWPAVLAAEAAAAAAGPAGHGRHHHRRHHHRGHHEGPHATAAAAAAAPVGAGTRALEVAAWRLALHDAALPLLTLTEAAAEADEPAPEYDGADAAAFLSAAGLRPEMASALAAPLAAGNGGGSSGGSPAASAPPLAHWALLLAHLGALPPRGGGARRLAQALRDIPELVPGLLDRLVGIMGLAGRGRRHHRHHRHGSASGGGGGIGSGEAAASSAASAGANAALDALAAQLSELTLAGGGGSGGGDDGASWSLRAPLLAAGPPDADAGSGGEWPPAAAAACYRAMLRALPASARQWFGDLRDRALSGAVEAYTSRHESPALLADEFAAIRGGAAGGGGGSGSKFRVRANPGAREVVAQLEIEDGASLDLLIRLPAAAPLRAPEVECRNKVGVDAGKLRKWLLSIAAFLRSQNQGVLDGVALWKANVDREFEGVEPCLICYSVLAASNGQLPKLTCRTCGVPFHGACLYRWFKSSGKSTCPHCQNAF